MASFLVIPTATFTLLLFLLFPAPTIVTGRVVDIDGDTVPNGHGEYYMVPYNNPIGAGPIGWVSESNTCPVDITRTAFTEHSRKSTITLSSLFLVTFIPEGRIFIRFNDEHTPCETNPLTWFLRPKIGMNVKFLELGAGPNEGFSFLAIENANIKGENVYILKSCEIVGQDAQCRNIVDKPDNSGLLGVQVGESPILIKPFQFYLVKAMSSISK